MTTRAPVAAGPNALVPVMYRDACNYKLSTEWVFAGEATNRQGRGHGHTPSVH